EKNRQGGFRAFLALEENQQHRLAILEGDSGVRNGKANWCRIEDSRNTQGRVGKQNSIRGENKSRS
ncbi:17938_t:CDS:1, partial [Gigaspora margarita]